MKALGRLPPEPFRLWMTMMVEELGIGNVASACKVDPARILQITNGRYYKRGKRYEVKWAHLEVVDRFATALGYHYKEIYPD